MIPLNHHLKSLIELAYKTDPQTADYHLSRLVSEYIYAHMSETNLKNLAMHLRFDNPVKQ